MHPTTDVISQLKNTQQISIFSLKLSIIYFLDPLCRRYFLLWRYHKNFGYFERVSRKMEQFNY